MELLDSSVAYEGYGVDVQIRRYRRDDGTEVTRQVIDHPGSVAILAHDDEFVYLVAQPREAVEEDGLLEIPAGTLDHEGQTGLAARGDRGDRAYQDLPEPRLHLRGRDDLPRHRPLPGERRARRGRGDRHR